MAKPRKNTVVQCVHFQWKIYRRQGVFYADGRGNRVKLGRHSLNTKELEEAKAALVELDQVMAEAAGLTPTRTMATSQATPLSLAKGFRLYREHNTRPAVTGGLKPSTIKKYRSHEDKLNAWLTESGVVNVNEITAADLERYAKYLKQGGPPSANKKSYTDKSISNELVFAKQWIKWLIEAGHLPGAEPIKLKLRTPESKRPYCWRPEEVAAMVHYCARRPHLQWQGHIIVALACTGLRISELVGLRWADADFAKGMLRLTDETGQAGADPEARRLKSGRSRMFPIHPALMATLEQLPREGRYVFYGPRGGRLKPDTVRRLLIRDVINPLKEKFPSPAGEQGFADGRLHSFRHYFCSTCADRGVSERMLMAWLGHADSEMVRHYYHLNDGVARAKMNEINFLGDAASGSSRAGKGTDEESPSELNA